MISRKITNELSCKPFSATKILFLVLTLTLFSINFVSAFEFDNVLSYEEKDMKVKFKNSIGAFGIGIPTSDLGTIELKSHSSITEIKHFGFGKEEVVMYYDFKGWELYKNGLGEVIFTDERTGKEIEKDYYFVEWKEVEVPNYIQSCFNKISANGTQFMECLEIQEGTKKEFQWVRYDSKDIPNRNVRIGLKTYVGKNDYVDGVWTIAGKKVKKHITWSGDLDVGLVSYYKMDEITGTNVRDEFNNNDGTANNARVFTTEVAGIINTGADFTQGADFIDISGFNALGGVARSISFWASFADLTASNLIINSDITELRFGFGISGSKFLMGATTLAHPDPGKRAFSIAGFSNDELLHFVITINSLDDIVAFYINADVKVTTSQDPFGLQAGTLIGARNSGTPSLHLDGVIDEFAIWNRTISQAEVTFLYNSGDGCAFAEDTCATPISPSVNLNDPPNNTVFLINNIDMNCTASDATNLVNVSLILDGVVNETNTPANNTLTNFNKILSSGDHNWTCRAANNLSLVTTADIRLFNINILVGTKLISPIDNQNFTTNIVNLVFNSTSTNQDLVFGNTTIWHSNGTLLLINSTSLSGSIEVQTTITNGLLDGGYIWTADTVGTLTTNATINRTFTVHTTPSNVIITSPLGNIESFAIGDSLNLNWSITEPGQNLSEHIVNCSFTYNDVETFLDNVSVCIETNFTTFLYVNGVNNLSFKVQEEFGLNTTNTTSWTFSFLETGIIFTGNVSETSSQTFDINLTTNLNVQSIAAILTYNGTNFTSTASCSSGDCMISNTLDIPLVEVGDFVLYNFFWNLAIFNGTDSSSIITSTRQQNVTRIFLEECNATFSAQTLNFTTRDEQTLEQIDPFNFDGTFDFWIGSGDIKRDNSFSNSDTETFLCLQPNVTMKIDATINYDEASDTNYTDRFYYFNEEAITNTSQDIVMYLLKSSSSTSFILKVQDDSLLPVSNALIEIHRFYPGTGEFRIVQIAKTDDAGKSIGFFETETVDYKFIIKKGGVTLLETGTQKVVPETSPFTLTFNIGEPLDEPWINQIPIEDLDSSLTFNNSNSLVSYIYTDSSGDFTQARLLVIKQSLINSSSDTTICNETSNLISATLVCNTTFTNGFYIASSFNSRGGVESLDLDKQFTFQIETLSSVVGFLGLFFGWFLILIASFMFKFNEIAGIWGITITVFLINIIGLINFGGVFVTAIVALAIIITWVMER